MIQYVGTWDYLFDVLEVVKFPTNVISWIRELVTTAKFSMNGSFKDFLKVQGV